MKIKDIDDLIKIVEVISQINIPNYIISINSDEIIKTLEEVKLILPVVRNCTLCNSEINYKGVCEMCYTEQKLNDLD